MTIGTLLAAARSGYDAAMQRFVASLVVAGIVAGCQAAAAAPAPAVAIVDAMGTHVSLVTLPEGYYELATSTSGSCSLEVELDLVPLGTQLVEVRDYRGPRFTDRFLAPGEHVLSVDGTDCASWSVSLTAL